MNVADISTPASMQVTNRENSGGSPVEQKARSLGVPDAVIARGPSAIKAWAQEHGKIPASRGGTPHQNTEKPRLDRTNGADDKLYDRFGQASEKSARVSGALPISFDLDLNA